MRRKVDKTDFFSGQIQTKNGEIKIIEYLCMPNK